MPAPAGSATGLPRFDAALAQAARIAARLWPTVTRSPRSTSAAASAPARPDERLIDLDAYVAVLARHLGPLGVAVGCEPGDYIAKDAAILLGEVVSVERKRGTTFIGLDLGWNVNCAYFIYRFLQEIVVCRAADVRAAEIVTVAGHINEAGDVFAEDYPMPPVERGRHRGAAQRRRLPPGDELDPLPPAVPGGGLPGPLAEAPQLRVATIAIRMIGRSSRRWSAYCGYFAREPRRPPRARGCLGRLEQRRRPEIRSQPEGRPVLGPAVDQQRHVRPGEDVADTSEVARVGDLLGLVVERAVEHRSGPARRGRQSRSGRGGACRPARSSRASRSGRCEEGPSPAASAHHCRRPGKPTRRRARTQASSEIGGPKR